MKAGIFKGIELLDNIEIAKVILKMILKFKD